MNNQEDLIYNISLTARETEDVMNALADRANILGALQKKVFNQAIQQKTAFEAITLGEQNLETEEEQKPKRKGRHKEEEVADGQ